MRLMGDSGLGRSDGEIAGASHLVVAMLTNFLPPSAVPLMRALNDRIGRFRVYLSTPMEPNRDWEPAWGNVPVTLQRSWTFERQWRHPDGFAEANFVHVPYDTLLLLHRQRPDVVVSNELGARTAQAAAYAKLCRKRLVIWATMSESTEKGRSWLRTLFRRLVLRAADAVIVNGRSGRRYIETLGRTRDVHEVPRPVQYDSYSSIGVKRDGDSRHSLLYVGRLSRGKGLVPFLGSLARWSAAHSDQRVRIRLVGSGPLGRRVESLDLPPNMSVAIEAHVPFEQLHREYARAGALVLPTIADEWGLVVAEALASGLPVLGSSASQAVDELVEDGVNGWVFDPLDPRSIDAAIERFFGTPSRKLEQMGRRAQACARRVDVDPVAQRFVDVIVRASQSRGGRAGG